MKAIQAGNVNQLPAEQKAAIGRFVDAEKRKAEAKKIYEDLDAAVENLVAVGFAPGDMFQDETGTVYKIVEPAGTFVQYKRLGFVRTRRGDEKKGDLSMTEAKEAGFELNG